MSEYRERWCETHKTTTMGNGYGDYCHLCVCNVSGCLGKLNDCCVVVDLEEKQ